MLHFLVKKMFTAHVLTASIECPAVRMHGVLWRNWQRVCGRKKLDSLLAIMRGENCVCHDMLGNVLW